MLINVRKAIVQQIFLLQEQILAETEKCAVIFWLPPLKFRHDETGQ